MLAHAASSPLLQPAPLLSSGAPRQPVCLQMVCLQDVITCTRHCVKRIHCLALGFVFLCLETKCPGFSGLTRTRRRVPARHPRSLRSPASATGATGTAHQPPRSMIHVTYTNVRLSSSTTTVRSSRAVHGAPGLQTLAGNGKAEMSMRRDLITKSARRARCFETNAILIIINLSSLRPHARRERVPPQTGLDASPQMCAHIYLICVSREVYQSEANLGRGAGGGRAWWRRVATRSPIPRAQTQVVGSGAMRARAHGSQRWRPRRSRGSARCVCAISSGGSSSRFRSRP